ISVAGYGSMNGQSYLLNGNDSHSLLTSLTKVYGRQTFIMGTDVRLHLINFFNVTSSAGSFSFAKAQTQGSDPNKASPTVGDGMASLLLGVGSGGYMPIGSGNELKDWYSAAYFQDNIRVARNLTVNLGMRYEEESPYTDRHNKLNYFSRDVQSPAANSTFPTLKGGLVFAGVNGNPSNVYDWNIFQLGPRAGVSYNPFRSTVIRAGAGVMYAPLEISNNAVGFSPNIGFSASTGWAATTNAGLIPENLLSNPFPQGLVQPAGSSLGAATSLGQGLNVWDPHPDTPQSYQWNFGIQQQLPSSILVEAAYVASRGLHLAHNFNINTLDPKYLSMGGALQQQVANPFYGDIQIGNLSNPKVSQQQLLLPFPQFTGINVENMTWGGSNYQSAQFKLNKRTSHGVSFLAAYTISKWMSNITSQDANIGPTNNTGIQSYYDLAAEKSLSENDIPQSLILNAVVDLPFGQGRTLLSNAHGIVEKLIGGWKASGILTEQKGQPLVFSAPITGGGNRPNWAPGVSPRLSSSRSNADKVHDWFNTDAFLQPDPFTLGNVSRTTGAVRAPGIQNLDFSLAKDTQLMERLHMQFRAEAFNLTNTPHFARPNTSLNSNLFGQITGVLSSPPPREIQFAVKLKF
ncbi:MAG TPA: hypothetical protein VFR08_06480, partial [Candidatus Angelobacter sp.]|nr:hypothetical protein [Candidatus Angelobacter sp.]